MIDRLNRAFLAGASPALLLLAGMTAAKAQSTATAEMETVIATAAGSSANGIMRLIEVPKQRSTIDASYLVTQPAGQTVVDSLNKIPGFNFTNNDPYGSSGGNIRLHGFDGNHISLTWDGMPLNDTGNYAIYTNQLPDSENIGTISVNQGATDVDSPSAAASGGTIAIRTSRPSDTFAVMFQPSFGSFSYQRYFGRVDFGAFGPLNTLGFISLTSASNDKFKGPGRIQKRQANAGFYQDMGDLGFITLGLHWNSNRNNNYAQVSFYPGVYPSTTVPAGFPAAPNVALDPLTGSYIGVARFGNSVGMGLDTDYEESCTRVAPGAGTVQNDNLCANYYRRQINPSDTGNIRISSLWRLADGLTLTVDPSIQYTLANGGSQYTQLYEADPRLIGRAAATGRDLNGDGDTLDRIGVFGPSNTNTIRYGINTSLLWMLTDGHAIQFAYTLDYGLHRQTGQATFLTADGSPTDVFGGWRDEANRVLGADGSTYRTRDRKSAAILNQGAINYEGDFLDGALHVSAGARMPFMTRELDQRCYVQVVAPTGTNLYAPGTGFPACTTAAPATVNTANNTVTLAGFGNTLFVAPAKTSVNYSRLLPSAGISYKPFGDSLQVFAAYATSLSAPRTDNLYNGGNNGNCVVANAVVPTNPGCVFSSFAKSVKLETSTNYALGARYNDDFASLSLSLYNNQFKNRIVSSFDREQGISIDRNIGSVNVNGVDVEAGIFPFEGFSSYTSVSYFHSRVSDTPDARICLNATCTQLINLVGKEVAESPNWTLSQRFQYKVAGFSFGFGAKFTGRRYATDTNDLRIPSYTVVDADISYDLGEIGWAGSFIKVNATNLFNEEYFGSISSQRCFVPNATTASSGCGLYPFVNVGSPQSFSVTLRSVF